MAVIGKHNDGDTNGTVSLRFGETYTVEIKRWS